MLVLGLAGGLNAPDDVRFHLPHILHDAAAALLRDGDVVAAVEEERLNRIKHSNCFPGEAIRFCLRQAGATWSDVDLVAYNFSEDFLNYQLRHYFLERQEERRFSDVRREIGARLTAEFGHLEADRVVFVDHHLAHAASAYAFSGFDRSLVAVLDGMGDNVAITIYNGESGRLRKLTAFPTSHSLGMFYLAVIHTLGFRLFDEYKVMALAPYGDPARFRPTFQSCYRLLDEGRFEIHTAMAEAVLGETVPPRQRSEPVLQVHRDVAATLQETLEAIVTHLLSHYRDVTGHTDLCLAGGVAHNCKLNGRLLDSGLFTRMFVQPAAHDAGTALGAALVASRDGRTAAGARPLRHVYLGGHVGSDDAIRDGLTRWGAFLRWRRADDVAAETAGLVAGGAVVGWVQGRSEFGPRALGHRSIVADPRPSANRDVVNRLVKKREGYRPFAPAVLEEDLPAFFHVPGAMRQFPFMTITVTARSEKAALLQAVTHVDGSARVQTVARDVSPEFWELISAFKRLTGVPVLLNTSFNNNVEPIVDSLDDAIVCFLTTGVHHLAVGNFLVDKLCPGWEAFLALVPCLPRHVFLSETVRSGRGPVWTVGAVHANLRPLEVAAPVYRLLCRADGGDTLGRLVDGITASDEERQGLVNQVVELWQERYVRLCPQ